jgi:uncharacterized membrane protein YdjX (TVP38/TMEM64 family)
MTAVAALCRALIGLFVDDGALACAIVGIIGVAAALALSLPANPLIAGAVLLFGCLGALLVNVLGSVRR